MLTSPGLPITLHDPHILELHMAAAPPVGQRAGQPPGLSGFQLFCFKGYGEGVRRERSPRARVLDLPAGVREEQFLLMGAVSPIPPISRPLRLGTS